MGFSLHQLLEALPELDAPGRAWLAFLDNRCPAAGLTRWMILVEGGYRADCTLDDKAVDGLDAAVATWIRKHV